MKDKNEGWLYQLSKLGLRMKALQVDGGDLYCKLKNLYSDDEIRLNNKTIVIKGYHINLKDNDSGFLLQ